MSRYLLDSSFVIDFLNEMARGEIGPARTWQQGNPNPNFWISPVTYAEVLEGADDPASIAKIFKAFRWQVIGQRHAERAAWLQRRSSRRLGENDAWQVAVAELMDASIVGHDPKAFGRLGHRYIDHRGKKRTTG